MAVGIPITAPVTQAKIAEQFQYDVPDTDGKFVLSRYAGLRVYDIDIQGPKFLPTKNLSFEDFLGTVYYNDPYPAPEVGFATQPTDIQVFINGPVGYLTVAPSINWNTEDYPTYRPDPVRFDVKYIWQKQNETGWENVGTNSNTLTITPGPDEEVNYYRCIVVADVWAPDDRDPVNLGPDIIVASNSGTSRIAKVITKEAVLEAPVVTVYPIEIEVENVLRDFNDGLIRAGSITVGSQYTSGSFTKPGYEVLALTSLPGRGAVTNTENWQWEYSADNGASWANVDGLTNITTNDDSRLSFTGLTNTTYDLYEFRLRVYAESTASNPTESLDTLDYSNEQRALIVTLKPTATYAIQPTSVSVTEGSTVTYTVETTAFGTGTLYWRVNGTTTDFLAVSGSIAMANDRGTFQLVSKGDADSGNESFTVSISTSPGGDVETTSALTLLDSTPTFALTPISGNKIENTPINMTVTATDFGPGTLEWDYTRNDGGTLAAFNPPGSPSIKTEVTTDNNGKGQFVLYPTMAGTPATSYSESFNINLYNDGVLVDTSTFNIFPEIAFDIFFKTLRNAATTITTLDGFVTQSGNAFMGFQGSGQGYSVSFPALATGTSEAYSWEYRRNSSDSWKTWTAGANQNGISFSNLTSTSLSGYQFRMKVVATANGITRTEFSNVATLTIYVDAQFTTPQLLSLSNLNSSTEGSGSPIYFRLRTYNAVGQTLTVSDGGQSGHLGGTYGITVTSDIMDFSIGAPSFHNFYHNESNSLSVSGFGQTLNSSYTVNNGNFSGSMSGAGGITVTEGQSFSISVSTVNTALPSGWSWDVSGSLAAALSPTSGSMPQTYTGSRKSGSYYGAVTVGTLSRPTHYEDVTGTINVYNSLGGLFASRSVTVKNIDSEISVSLFNVGRTGFRAYSLGGIYIISLTMYPGGSSSGGTWGTGTGIENVSLGASLSSIGGQGPGTASGSVSYSGGSVTVQGVVSGNSTIPGEPVDYSWTFAVTAYAQGAAIGSFSATLNMIVEGPPVPGNPL